MTVLVLGGTGFIGRHIVGQLVERGHTICVLSRGLRADALPAQVECLRGDRDDGAAGLEALGDRQWDACVDLSGYTPTQVRASAERPRGRVGRYVYISAVSVYGDPASGPVLETFPLLPAAAEDVVEVNGETYGPLKVACEGIVTEFFGEAATILRPQVVVGACDGTPRLAYWLNRVDRGGEMLAPGDGDDFLQIIDARDVAGFVARIIENGVGGVFNLAGPRITWREFMGLLGAGNLVWVSRKILEAANFDFQVLPLYRPNGGPRSSLMHVSNERASAAGLIIRDFAKTLADARMHAREVDLSYTLSPEREVELIRQARQ